MLRWGSFLPPSYEYMMMDLRHLFTNCDKKIFRLFLLDWITYFYTHLEKMGEIKKKKKFYSDVSKIFIHPIKMHPFTSFNSCIIFLQFMQIPYLIKKSVITIYNSTFMLILLMLYHLIVDFSPHFMN